MKKNIIIPLLLVMLNVNSQWKYNSGEDKFDGKYRTASVIGNGYEFPYKNPILVINYFEGSNYLNIYLDNCGYSGCDNNQIQIIFDDNKTLYEFDVSSDKNNEVWFLKGNVDNLLISLKKFNIAYVRIESSCMSRKFKFSLLQSTKAINYVLELYNKDLEKQELLINEKLKKQELLINEINKGILCKGKLKYNASIFYEPKIDCIDNTQNFIKINEFINFYKNPNINDFYVITETNEIIFDTIYYISKYSIDLNSVIILGD